MTIGIYKITNKINNKCYIGQSINIEKRWDDHRTRYLKESSKFYRAIQEFGIENFEFSIIEKCSKEELDNRENYWINYYDSVNKGYNGIYGAPFQRKSYYKITENQYQELIKDLIDNRLSIKELNKKYNLCETYIYDINRGNNRNKDDNLNYPLRPVMKQNSVSTFIEENIDNIINDLQNLNLSLKNISDKYNICEMTLRRICTGERYYRENIKYPIRVFSVYLTQKQADEIINLLKNSNKTIKEIANLYHKSTSSISSINNGESFHNIEINYPIRKCTYHKLTKEEVKKIIELLINTDIPIIDIGKQFNVSDDSIRSINRGRTYKDASLIYPLRTYLNK